MLFRLVHTNQVQLRVESCARGLLPGEVIAEA